MRSHSPGIRDGLAVAGTAFLLVSGLSAYAEVPARSSPPRVHLNQVGFETSGPKMAVVASASKEPLPWSLRNPGGRILARGRTVVFGEDAASGTAIHRVDFGSYGRAGRGLRIVVGAMESDPFAIEARPYATLARDALSFFYQQRSGEDIVAAHVQRADLARPAGHGRELVTCFKGVDGKGVRWPGCDYTLNVTGGWYDAGDHGKYVVNGGLSAWTLLDLVTRLEKSGDRSLADAVRAEAGIEVRFLLAMQIPDGVRLRTATKIGNGVPAGGFRDLDAGGLAHSKVADAAWTGLPTAPADDRQPRALYPPTSAATLNLAAVAAKASVVWRDADPAFAKLCLEAAVRAWRAAERHPHLMTESDFPGSGGYGDEDVSDERFWAAAELLAASGDAAYLAVVRKSPHLLRSSSDLSWARTDLAGLVTLAGTTTSVSELARTRILEVADGYMRERERSGHRLPYASSEYMWGSNGMLLNRALVLGVAARLTGSKAYRSATIDVLDYVLGRNPLGRSYVSGYGARPMRNPHHRFWAASLDARYPAPPPGVLSGGPNSSRQHVVEGLEDCVGQTCWVDRAEAYTMNEVAINWNAPLLWVAGNADATRAGSVGDIVLDRSARLLRKRP